MHIDRERCNRVGLEAVAVFEAIKGLLALLFAMWMLPAQHRDLSEMAARVISKLHLDPDARVAQAMVHAAAKFADVNPALLLGGLAAYTVIRFVEAYGLWRARAWAEWFALISGCLYLPFEVYEIARRQTWLRWSVLIVNLVIVSYMAAIRWQAHKHRDGCPEEVALPQPAA